MPENERVARIRHEMKEERWDALVCALPANVLMMSGYWPIVGTALAVLSSDGLVILAPEDEEHLARRSWATEVRTFHPGSLQNLKNATDCAREPLSRLLRGCVRIGFENGAVSEPGSYVAMHLYSAAMRDLVKSACPNAELMVADDTLTQLKSVKTADEIGKIREAAKVASVGYENGLKALGAGLTEIRAASAFMEPLSAAAMDREGTERSGGHVSCMSGARSGKAFGAFARSTGKRIAEGDLVLTHCNSQVDGYWTDITRTFHIGDLSAKQRSMYEALLLARDAAMAAIRPGAAACEVDKAARTVIDKHGFGPAFKHSTGHGIGFGAIDAHALPRLHPKSPDRIEAGMVFNVEPGIYFEGFGGMRQCEMVAVTSRGVELLTPFLSRIEDLNR